MNKVIPGINDLETCYPDIAREVHPNRNNDIKTNELAYGSHKKIWWLGYNCKHEWVSTVHQRTTNKSGCPICKGKQVLAGYNDLETLRPDIAAEWHPTLNENLKPSEVTEHSGKKVWWFGTSCGHTWQATICHRTIDGSGCPICNGKQVLPGFNDLATTHPHIARQWHPTKNGDLQPTDVTYGSNKKFWFKCAFSHEWEGVILDRMSESGCPYCAGRFPTNDNNLLFCFPEIAKEWDFEANKDLTDKYGRNISTPDKVTPKSHVRAHWVCSKGHHWQAIVKSRTQMKSGCPCCNVSKGEEAVQNVLISNNIVYRAQNTFPDRKFFGKALRDDFALIKDNKVIATIEYHGQQHYEYVDFSGRHPEKHESSLKRIQDRDKVKSDYLKAHGIPQLIIPYWQFNEIEQLVIKFLKELGLIKD